MEGENINDYVQRRPEGVDSLLSEHNATLMDTQDAALDFQYREDNDQSNLPAEVNKSSNEADMDGSSVNQSTVNSKPPSLNKVANSMVDLDESTSEDDDFDDDDENDTDMVLDDQVDDVHETENTTPIKTSTKKKRKPKDSSKAKKKRKRKEFGMRRNIRNVFSDEKLADQTRKLREFEQERLKRLGIDSVIKGISNPSVSVSLINRLASINTVPTRPPAEASNINRNNKHDVICLDSDSDDEPPVKKATLNTQQKYRPATEIVVLSSDSDEEDISSAHDAKKAQSEDYYSELGLHTNDALNIPDECGRILVNVNHNEKDKDIFLHPTIGDTLQPHQIGGVRFLYDNLIETIHGFRSVEGSGCILAHAMGLGKTIQTITFINLFLKYTPSKKVLCVVPVNTIQNWINEFNRWLPPVPGMEESSVKENEKKKKKYEVKISGKSVESDQEIIKNLLEDVVEFIDYRIDKLNLQEQKKSEKKEKEQCDMGNSMQTPTDSTISSQPCDKIENSLAYNVADNKMDVPNDSVQPGYYCTQKKESKQEDLIDQLHSSAQFLNSVENQPNNPIFGSNVGSDQPIKKNTAGMQNLTTDAVPAKHPESLTAHSKEHETHYRHFQVFLVDSMKSQLGRAKIIDEWDKVGGVLLIGYEMYRSIALYSTNKKTKGKPKKSLKDEDGDVFPRLKKAICRPGPDLVVCDEGHRIRNYQSGISQALKSIKTRKRLVLTGYPLQNNLIEYWCMVDFVRPNYLGSRQEFSNMFERPIMNGQCVDSTKRDKHLMRQRAHVLYSLLEGFVQRRGHDVFKSILPDKEEHVIMIRLSPIQKLLYQKLTELTKDAYNDSLNPIKTFCLCCKIWNHPDILYKAVRASLEGQQMDILNDEDDITLDDGTTRQKRKKKSPSTRSSPLPSAAASVNPSSNFSHNISTTIGFDPFGTDAREILMDMPKWAGPIFKNFHYSLGAIENSGKFFVLKQLIEESIQLGDRMLIFSQSLLTLTTIEEMLQRMETYPHSNEYFKKGQDYYRLDGGTGSLERERLINAFNHPDNMETKLFLLSTKAGCLGINLVAANRVVVFDVSWNPCHDAQAVCRIYRYGQTKPCFIYRLVSSNTMEKKIYYRQISKIGISDRVVDELNLTENFSKNEIQSLVAEEWVDEPVLNFNDTSTLLSNDDVLFSTLKRCANWITKLPFKHESLLIDESSEKLSGSEKRAAKRAYEEERMLAQGSYVPYRSYPLQENFPRNTPVAPVRPFLWRPPTSSSSWPTLYQDPRTNPLVASNVTIPSSFNRSSSLLNLLRQRNADMTLNMGRFLESGTNSLVHSNSTNSLTSTHNLGNSIMDNVREFLNTSTTSDISQFPVNSQSYSSNTNYNQSNSSYEALNQSRQTNEILNRESNQSYRNSDQSSSNTGAFGQSVTNSFSSNPSPISQVSIHSSTDLTPYDDISRLLDMPFLDNRASSFTCPPNSSVRLPGNSNAPTRDISQETLPLYNENNLPYTSDSNQRIGFSARDILESHRDEPPPLQRITNEVPYVTTNISMTTSIQQNTMPFVPPNVAYSAPSYLQNGTNTSSVIQKSIPTVSEHIYFGTSVPVTGYNDTVTSRTMDFDDLLNEEENESDSNESENAESAHNYTTNVFGSLSDDDIIVLDKEGS